MHVLFGMPHTGYLRNFEAGVGAVLDRGHRVTLAVGKVLGESRPILERLGRRGDVAIQKVPGVDRAPTAALGGSLRGALDYWHYLDPRFDAAPALRDRARDEAPPRALWLERSPPVVRRLLAAGLHEIERRLPVPESLVRFIRGCAPDVMLLTPLIYVESPQVLWVRAARRLGIPSVFGVHSWDNLTTKGTLHEMPDRVLLWNDAQRAEAVEQHGIDPARCVVTGATAFDHWFTTQPTLSRDAFLRELGLPEGRAVILYLCSSQFITKDETPWVGEWLAAVRRAPDARVREAAVLIRPHPQNAAPWGHWSTTDRAARVFPERGENPVSDEARVSYFHSLLHSDAVAGLNTSALIEAAILDRPVLTIVTPHNAARQRGTLHFGHIEQGLLSVASDLETHVAQLADAVAGRSARQRSRQFVEQFVRPRGLDRPAGVQMAEALEALVGSATPGSRARAGVEAT